MDQEIPIIMCVDVEPDDFFLDRSKPLPWKGYEKCYEIFPELRSMLEAGTGSPVHFNWFYRMDPQVAETYGSPDWVIRNYPRFIETFIKAGDELGLHQHGYRWEENAHKWIVDHGNQKWIDHCIEMGFETFKRLFSKTCKSFRFGASWINGPSLNTIEKLGGEFDLSIEPNYKPNSIFHETEVYTGRYENFDHIPRHPYRRSKNDFRKEDKSAVNGLFIIPLSTGKIAFQYGMAEKLRRAVSNPKSLMPQFKALNVAHSERTFTTVTETILNSLEPKYLALVVRSESPLFGQQLKNIKSNFQHLMNHKFAKRFVFSTPEEALRRLGYLKERETVHS